ncbi:MAG: hypothetical protein K0S65_3575 [Labilithrix sp.]|nr:hypothetical protein [Labilithrix sp.]
MASKKESGPLRGAKLVKKALEAAKERVLAAPEPMPSSLARKMKLPNGESLSAGLKELLLADTEWIAIDYDDEEAEIESVSLEDIVEEAFGEEAVAAFGEAYELLGEDVVAFGAEDLSRPACLYIGEVDEAGEYPVLQLAYEAGKARVGGFIPFDVWLAQELGALERGKDIGDVPAEYAALPKALAESNFDGRIVFEPKAGEAEEGEDEDEDGSESESESDDSES